MALKKNKLMIYTTIRMNLTNVILNNNKKIIHRSTYYVILFTSGSRKGKII